MANDYTINANLNGLPPRSSVGKVGTPTTQPGEQKLRKSLGDPPPPLARLRDYPEGVQQAFAYAGILQVLKRKLNAISGEKYELAPAQGEVVCIDENGVVFVGCDFVEKFLPYPAVLGGVLAHEWGHFPTRRKNINLDLFSWDEVYRLRRREETQADVFCGRALFVLQYSPQPVIEYLKSCESKDPQEKSPKYHSVASRAKVILQSYHSQKSRDQMAGNLRLDDFVYRDPIHGSKIIG